MSILVQNPFRVLGLFGNASEREIQKQIGIIKRYAEIGKFKSFDYDFDFIGGLSRNIEDIQLAASKIEQDQKKLHYSVFWFIQNNQFDEIAFNKLKNQDIEKAIEIWDKTLKDVSEKNFSSYINLSTLYLALSIIKDQIELQYLQKAIDLKGKLIHSNFINNFSSFITSSGLKIDSTTISRNFVEEIIELLKPYLNKKNGINTNELISLFNSYPSSIQKYIIGRFTEAPISNIENNIVKTAQKRKNNPENADKFGEDLYNLTKTDLALLNTILGNENVQFQMIVNKLANEILQCSIEFFNDHREKNDIDPGDDAIRIAGYAGSIGASGQINQRIIENSAIIQDWVDDKPNRKKHEVVSEEIVFLESKFKWFQGLPGTVENARNMIKSCKPKLISMKSKLGRQDDFYLQISSLVVNSSLNMIIEVVNREQNQSLYDRTKLITLPSTISQSLSVLKLMGSFDMIENVRSRYNTNKNTISSINSQLKALPSTSSGGCYIATMVYGNYNHPQVLILRKFRDERLATTFSGKCFIKFYYSISPLLTKIIKKNIFINKCLKILLDKLIKQLYNE